MSTLLEINGLCGLRPIPEKIAEITTPPYDVIPKGSHLDLLLKKRKDALTHITLGENPKETLNRFKEEGIFQEESEPALYIYVQEWNNQKRIGVLCAPSMHPYHEGIIVRHEKTFDDKVKGRQKVYAETEHSFEPVFLLTKEKITPFLQEIVGKRKPTYAFISAFDETTDLHNIKNTIYRIPSTEKDAQHLTATLIQSPLYIADGHHRYHAALLDHHTHFLGYICDSAQILAYNRVITGTKKFAEIKNKLTLKKVSEYRTPKKHTFCIYTKDGIYVLKSERMSSNSTHPLQNLDCTLLEQELYSLLGLDHSMILNSKHFAYYPETQLHEMKRLVDAGSYNIAVALHPASIQELMRVADAGVRNQDIVMPEKSTYFSPKILSGIIAYRFEKKE